MLRQLAVILLLSGCASATSVLAGDSGVLPGTIELDETENPGAAAGDAERLLVEVPEGWHKVVDRKAGTLHLAEYYPASILEGAADQWTQKLTIEALSGDDLPDPLVFAAGLADQQRKLCNDFSDNTVFAGFENGYPTVVHMLECGQSQNTGRAVITMLKIIQGNQSLYTITRIWRLPPPAPPMVSDTLQMDQAELAAWSQALRKAQVCDPTLAAHPCPGDEPG